MAIPFLGRKNEGDAPSSPVSKVVPSVSVLAQVRRIHEGAVEDYSGNRFAVWSVGACNCANPQVTNGWSLLLNSVDYPVQIIIRQHAPDLSGYRAKLIEDRPAHMRSGRINDVGNSLLDYPQSMEEQGDVLDRCWYVVSSEAKEMEMASLMAQSGFNATRLGDDELGLLLQASISGMGYGYTREFYQVQEHNGFIELNQRYMSVHEVLKWPRRISLLFLEQMLPQRRRVGRLDVAVARYTAGVPYPAADAALPLRGLPPRCHPEGEAGPARG